MKKIIEIDDNLFEKLTNIQKDYSINSLTPVISLVLTLGVNWFKKLEAIVPHTFAPPVPYEWNWIYPMSGSAGEGTIDNNEVEVKWNVIKAISGCIDNDR